MFREIFIVIIMLVVFVLGGFFLTDWPAVWDWLHTPRTKLAFATGCWILSVVCIILLIPLIPHEPKDKS